MASTNCIVQRGNSFIVRFAGIIHLGEKQVWLYENIFYVLNKADEFDPISKLTSYMILCTRSNSPSSEASKSRAKGLNFTRKLWPVLSESGFFRLVLLVWTTWQLRLNYFTLTIFNLSKWNFILCIY